MDYFSAKLDPRLTFVDDIFPLAAELVENNVPFLAFDNDGRGLFPNHKPLLQISFAAIKMSLIFGSKPLLFQFLSYLTARDTFRISLQNFDDSEMDLARPAGVGFLMRGSHRVQL